MASMDRPLRASTFCVAGMTPVSMSSGSLPDTAKVWNLARGRRPSSAAFSSLMISAGEALGVRLGVVGGLQPGKTLGSGGGPHGLIGGVGAAVGQLDTDDLVVEATACGGRGGARVRPGRVGVERLAVELPPGSNQL